MKTKPFEIHEAAKIMPPMSDAEYRALKDDIEANGLKNPVALLDGKVLDGIHRMQACIDLGMTLRTFDAKLNGSTPAEYVLSQNLHRRHLDESQRGMVAARLKKHLAEKTSDTVANLPPDKKTRDLAGETLNVSGRTVQSATKVLEEGSKALQDAVDAGEVAVSTAAKVATLPKAEQAKAVKAGPKGIKKAVEKVEKQKANADKPAPETFDDSIIETLVGKLARAIDDRYKIMGSKSHRDACHSDLNEFITDWKGWKKQAKGTK